MGRVPHLTPELHSGLLGFNPEGLGWGWRLARVGTWDYLGSILGGCLGLAPRPSWYLGYSCSTLKGCFIGHVYEPICFSKSMCLTPNCKLGVKMGDKPEPLKRGSMCLRAKTFLGLAAPDCIRDDSGSTLSGCDGADAPPKLHLGLLTFNPEGCFLW